MLIKRSDLKLDNFTMHACNFATVPTEKKKKLSGETLKKLPIDLDFDITINKNNSSKVRIYLEANCNQGENPKPGYMYSIVCSAEYTIKGLGKKPPRKRKQYILYTALPLAISMVRSQLYNVSSNFEHGHYLLPSIDLPDLLEKKREQR